MKEKLTIHRGPGGRFVKASSANESYPPVAVGVLIVALVLIVVLAYKHLSSRATFRPNVSQNPPISITSPAMFADPQLDLERPESAEPAPLIIVLGPYTVRGWRDGEPVLFEGR